MLILKTFSRVPKTLDEKEKLKKKVLKSVDSKWWYSISFLFQRNGEAVAFKKKIKASLLNDDEVICPDPTFRCKIGTTCCKIGYEQYGCCPMPDAVCCRDMKHCCPHGTHCDMTTTKCYKVKLKF